MRILHVDDDQLVRELIKISMGRLGHDVLSFQDGPAALDHLRTHPVDLIISDVTMPGMNGAQFVGAVRDEALSGAPVVFLTSGFDPRTAALEALAPVAILGKPFDPFELPAEIERRMARVASSQGAQA